MKWLADECFDNDIVRGLFRRAPQLDLVRAQDVDRIAGCDDGTLLAWATENGRVVLTHDVTTMIPALLLRRQEEARCAPIVLVPGSLSIGTVIDESCFLTIVRKSQTGLPVWFIYRSGNRRASRAATLGS